MCANRISRRASIEELLSSFQREFNLNPSRPLFKITYKQPPTWPISLSKPDHKKPIRIAVLDSSFNPPTKAHLQLIMKSVTNIHFQNNQPVTIQIPEKQRQIKEQPSEFFDACLLLFAIKNADKMVTSSDASIVDRISMMEALASYIRSTAQSDSLTAALQNLAVGVTTHPIFTDKARAILTSLSKSSDNPSQSFSLYFIMGYDTIIRFFNPKYYTNMPEELASFFETNSIICANRQGYGGEEAEEQFFCSEIFKEIVGGGEESGKKVIRIKLDDEIAKMSSTRVREILINMKNEEEVKEHQVKIRNALLDLCPEPIVDFVIQEGLYRKVC
ncbi:2716_t:CDS:1 [Funneliformis geosporum]|uniref:15495_t:CDS:1 n=1 Tax=Funneliformis geosporum TaxID=1117311 RepID=A0A9W4SKV1_9GLOM|nr:2716_t:CDS:1 [Funneliformis geosporum]CAI2170633.1 15495_t:CDS:1 [Funneliformis geosporum]